MNTEALLAARPLYFLRGSSAPRSLSARDPKLCAALARACVVRHLRGLGAFGDGLDAEPYAAAGGVRFEDDDLEVRTERKR